MHSNLIPVTYREPFAIGKRPWHDVRVHGQTVLEIVKSVPDLPRSFLAQGIVCINNEEVPREMWSYVRPKCPTDTIPIAVTLHLPMRNPGGGSSGTKSIVGLVAAIALIAVAAAITGGAASGLIYAGYGEVGFFAAGSTSAQLLAGAVTITGALAISALTKPPTTDSPTSSDINSNNLDPAGASGNVIAPGGSIPRVLGFRTVFPPIVGPPFVEQISDLNEQLSVVFALNGPHDISAVYVDGVSTTGLTDVNVELRAGESTDTALSIVTRQGRIVNPNVTLSQHILNAGGFQLLTGNLTTEVAQWHRFTTNDSPDDVCIHLLFPGGVSGNGSGLGNSLIVPFRMRMRLQGTSTWLNFPEFHLNVNSARQTRRQIRLRWGLSWSATAPLPTVNGWYYLTLRPPPQTSFAGAGATWLADAHFDLGSGNVYSYSGVEASSAIRQYNVSDNYTIDFYMSPKPQGRYEIEIMRGFAFFEGRFTKNIYVYNSAGLGSFTYDFFNAATSAGQQVLAEPQNSLMSACQLVRCVSIWNSAPTPTAPGKFALIALTAINRNIQRVSADVGGRVHSWNGSNWTTVYGPNSNPAAHYRDVLLGAQNHDPLASALVDDTTLVSWYNLCNTAGHVWTVDAIVDDMRTQDVLDLIASCGYARPYQSDLYGVVIDKDRSGDSPIQVFSRVNTASMQFSKAFAKAPAGLIVNYHNTLNAADSIDQTVVLQSNPSVGTTGLYETVNYDGLVDVAKVNARAQFDLDQANLRSTFYTFDTDIESIVCRRGDLVALQHDVLTLRAGDARIKTVLTSGGNITGFVLDSIIPCVSGTGIAIRRQDGTITTHAITNTSDTNTVTLTTPFAIVSTIVGYDDTGDEYGCLVVSGDIATVYKRMLVQNIATKADLKATITLVDEAPTLVRY